MAVTPVPLQQRVGELRKWMIAGFVALALLILGSIVIAAAYDKSIWHLTSKQTNVISSVHNNAMLGARGPTDAAEPVPGTGYSSAGGYFLGNLTTEDRQAGLQVIQNPVTGQRVTVMSVDPMSTSINDTCDFGAFTAKSHGSNCTSRLTGVNTYDPQCTFDVNGDSCINGGLTMRGNITWEGGVIINQNGATNPMLICNGKPDCDVFECFFFLDPVCNDNNTCTTDGCHGGTCLHETIAGGCSIDADCWSDPAFLCNTTSCQCYNACLAINCTANATNACIVSSCIGGQCVPQYTIPGCCGTNAQCDDGNPCTLDTCAKSVCHHTPNTCALDSDCRGNFLCNTTNCTCYDSCGSVSCPSNNCTLYECIYGQCVFLERLSSCCLFNFECDDGNSCTTDTCNLTNHQCVFTSPVSGCAWDGQCAADEFCTGNCTCYPAVLPPNNTCILMDEPIEIFSPYPGVAHGIDAPALQSANGLAFFDGKFGSSVAMFNREVVIAAPLDDMVVHYHRRGPFWTISDVLYRAPNASNTDIGIWANTVAMSENLLVIGHCTKSIFPAFSNSLPSGIGYISLYELNGNGTYSWIRDFDNAFIGLDPGSGAGPNLCVSKVDIYDNSIITIIDTYSNRFFILEYNGTDWIKFQSSVRTAQPSGIAIDRVQGNLAAISDCAEVPLSCDILVYSRVSIGVWAIFQFITTPTTLNGDWTLTGSAWAFSLSLSNGTLVVGAPNSQFSDPGDITQGPRQQSGIVTIHTQSGVGTNFTLAQALYPPRMPAQFGWDVSITSESIFVGAPTDANCPLGCPFNGAVYVYSSVASIGYPLRKRQNAEFFQGPSMRFGNSVSGYGSEFVAGVPQWRNLGQYDGMAFLFSCTAE